MSLKVSRRNFMKLSAAAALAVAGSSLLTGCSDPNKPTRNGDGALTLISATIKVERSKDNENQFTVEIKNGRTNDLHVTTDAFHIVKREGDSLVDYAATIDKPENVWAIKKGETKTITVTANVTGTLGNDFTLQFRPDDTYDEMYASWIYGKTEK